MTRLGRFLSALILVVAAGAGGWAAHRILSPAKAPETAEGDEDPAPAVPPGEMSVKVKMAAASAGDLPIVVDAVGVVRPERTASCTISSRAFGRVIEVAVSSGEVVKNGDLVARFEPEPMRAAASDKQAALQLAENQLVEFDKVGRDRQIVELTAAVRTAASELRLAQAQLDRLAPLVKEKLVADKAFEEAGQAVEKATQDRERAAHALAAYESMGAALQRASLETTRAAAATALEDAKAVLAAAEVRAPSDGQVTSVAVRRGDRLEAGAPIGAMLCTGSRLVVFGLPPGVARSVPAGARAGWLDVEGQPRGGAVSRVVSEVNATTGLVDVVVQPDAGGADSPPGLILKGEIEVDRKRNVVLVPAKAVVRAADHTIVAVVTDGKAAIVPVEVLGRHGETVAVAGAVKAGDEVVVEGAYALPDGAHVVEEEDESRPADSRATESRATDSKPAEHGK